MKEFDELCWLGIEGYECVVWFAGVRSCYDEGKRTAETLAMDYHRGADVQVQSSSHSSSFF